MSEQNYEYKSVKIPMNQPRGRTRILNKYAKDGWELTDTMKGGLFATKDIATLRRVKKR